MASIRVKAIFLTVVLFAAWGGGIQTALAEIFYPSNNYRVQGPPTYCTIVTGISEPQSKINEFVSVSSGAVKSWTENLQSAEDGVKGVWQMDHRSVGSTQPECDIMVQYKPYYGQSTQPAAHDIIAGTFSSTGIITIYYLQPFSCDDSLCYYDGRYRDQEDLYGTMLHEIGHSLGSGHYVSDNPDENARWSSGQKSPPSIMIPSIPPDIHAFTLKDADIAKIRQIYGSDGFYAYSDKDVPVVHPFVTIDVSSDRIKVSGSSFNTMTISGQIARNVLLDGHPVIISVIKPDHTVEVLKISHTRNGYFEVLTSYDSTSPLGLYTVSVSYLGSVDNEMDVHFEVTNTSADRQVSMQSTDPEKVISMHSASIDSLKAQAENLKKTSARITMSDVGKASYNTIIALGNTADLKIGSAELQIENAKERLAAKDYESVFIALKNLDTSIKSAASALDRISDKVSTYERDGDSVNLDVLKDAARRMNAGMGDGSGFAAEFSRLLGADAAPQTVPEWIRTVSAWWIEGRVSDGEIGSMLEYLKEYRVLP